MKKNLFTFSFLLFTITLFAQQPSSVTVSGCSDSDWNGTYTTIVSTSGGCNCYQKDNSNNVLTRISAFGDSWNINTFGNCGQQQFLITGTGETDCDPTNGPTAQNGCVLTETVVPVELMYFKAEEKNETVVLSWQTASELNNEKFEIEESFDGQEFQKIGELEGNGTTFKQQNYTYEVENPRNRLAYYRLKQVDFDGQFEYSEIINIDFKGQNGEVGEFYPNPSKTGLVNLDYTSQNDDAITISIFDMTGKLLINQVQQLSIGDNNLNFDFSDLSTGIYVVKIGNGINSIHRRLIIE